MDQVAMRGRGVLKVLLVLLMLPLPALMVGGFVLGVVDNWVSALLVAGVLAAGYWLYTLSFR